MTLLQSIDYAAIAPILAAGAGVVVVLVADVALPLRRRAAVLWLGVAAAAASVVASLALAGQSRATFCTPATTLPGSVRVGPSCSYVVDRFTVFLLVTLSAATLVALVAAAGAVQAPAPADPERPAAQEPPQPAGEYTLLVLCSLTGALTLVGARDLLTLVVGLETLTLPTYILVGLRRRSRRSAEAAVKYLLVSVAASAVMLLGIALVYGLTGTVHLDRVATVLAARGDIASLPLISASIILVLVGFGFKVTLVPFHWWAPDVYQGAPVPVAAYLATVSKAAGVAGLLLVLVGAFPAYGHTWGPAIAVLSAASMTLGNLVALRQRDAVRLLAWSSIAHAGYLVAPLGIALTARGQASLDVAVGATLGYLALYVAMNLGAFCCLAAAGRTSVEGLRGLAATHPWLATAFGFFLVCLAGLPPGLAGLVAKVVVFRATLVGGLGWLAVVMAVNTVIGLAYYVRVAATLFRAPEPATAGAGTLEGAGAAGASTAGTSTAAVTVGNTAATSAATLGEAASTAGGQAGGAAGGTAGSSAARLVPAVAVAVAVTVLVTVALGFAPQIALGAVPHFAAGAMP